MFFTGVRGVPPGGVWGPWDPPGTPLGPPGTPLGPPGKVPGVSEVQDPCKGVPKGLRGVPGGSQGGPRGVHGPRKSPKSQKGLGGGVPGRSRLGFGHRFQYEKIAFLTGTRADPGVPLIWGVFGGKLSLSRGGRSLRQGGVSEDYATRILAFQLRSGLALCRDLLKEASQESHSLQGEQVVESFDRFPACAEAPLAVRARCHRLFPDYLGQLLLRLLEQPQKRFQILLELSLSLSIYIYMYARVGEPFRHAPVGKPHGYITAAQKPETWFEKSKHVQATKRPRCNFAKCSWGILLSENGFMILLQLHNDAITILSFCL